MIVVKASAVIVPEGRFREVFNEKALLDLEDSIDRIGILNPIVVEESADGPILRAGERRLRVLRKRINEGKSLRVGSSIFSGDDIPATSFGELSNLQRMEVEVEENVYRADFDWRERTRALTALHELRKKQNPQQTTISDALIVARHLDDPDVAKAKSQNEAMKIVKKKAETAHRARLANAYSSEGVAHTLLLGDCKTHLANLAPGLFDVIVADPPYGIGADGFGSMSGEGHDYKDSAKVFEGLVEWLPESLYRVTKSAAHCYLFCDIRNFERLHTLMVLAGWTVFNTPLIWDKCGSGMLPFPENGPRRTHEYILYAWKGNRRTLAVKSDVIRVPAVKGLKHGAQKPVALYQDLLSRSALPGDVVLDCFGGSGPILVAANNTRTVATYIEQNEDSYNIALERVHTKGFDDGVQEDDGIDITV